MPTMLRRYAKALGIVVQSETQIHTGSQQLPRQRRATAKAVHRPHRCRFESLVKPEQFAESPHTMYRYGQRLYRSHLHLTLKDCALQLQRCTAQSVEPAFAQSHHLRMPDQRRQSDKHPVDITIGPPRMNAGRIGCTIRWLKGFGRQQDFERQRHNSATGRSRHVMCMEIREQHLFVFLSPCRKTTTSSGNRVVTASTPRMASQQSANGQPQPLQWAMLSQSLNRILRTRGCETTSRRRVGGNKALIKTYGSYEQPRQDFAYHRL